MLPCSQRTLILVQTRGKFRRDWSWQHVWKTFEIVRYLTFFCFQSVVHVVSERKHCTFYLENLCNLSCTEKPKSLLFKRLSSDCSDIYCKGMFWTYPPSTHAIHEAPFRPIKHNRSTEDATLTLVHNVFTHFEKPGSFVRILFVDISSAFSTIQRHLLASTHLKLDVKPKLILWIVDFLVNHSQTVRHQAELSSSRSISTSCPQGTVLSPILFTLYTNDCTGTDTTPVTQKNDDSAMEHLSNSDSVI